MKLNEFYRLLEERIPKQYACAWDNDGLMCAADMNAEVRRVLCTLDVTDDVLRHAAANGFDAVLSHHPLIFRPLGALTPANHIARKTTFALKNDIAVLSYHTRFDTMPGGMNDLLAGMLGIENAVPFGDGESEIGRVGNLTRITDIYEFSKQIKFALGSSSILLAKAGNIAYRVAVVGGDGKDFIRGAVDAGADTLVSGRLSYNCMTEAAEMGISLIEAGHFFTENIICGFYMRLLAEIGVYGETYYCNKIEIV